MSIGRMLDARRELELPTTGGGGGGSGGKRIQD